MMFRTFSPLCFLTLVGLLLAPAAYGQDDPKPAPAAPPAPGVGAPSVPADSPLVNDPTRQKAPVFSGEEKVNLDFVDVALWDLVVFFADKTERNFIIADQKELSGKKVTMISHEKVSVREAWEAFLVALEVHGFTVAQIGTTHKIVKIGDASQEPHTIGIGDNVPATERVITQLITLKNISASEINKVISSMLPAEAKVVAYVPTNMLIITDTGFNLRKIVQLVQELDVAAPKSRLEILPIVNAQAADIKALIEELYGTEESSPKAAEPARPARAARRRPAAAAETETDSVTAGVESKYISKVMSDERTNSLIVLANDEGHQAVADLVAKLDVDVDPFKRSQIHVVTLEHAKAEEVSQVLSELSSAASSQKGATTTNAAGKANAARKTQAAKAAAATAAAPGDESGAVAAFDSGLRIAADENTNSLILIATQEDFEIIKKVIDQLDIRRRMVFVDVVIMEITSQDDSDFSLALHTPFTPDNKFTGLVGAQLGTNSIGGLAGLASSALSGLAFGVFGESIEVPLGDGSSTAVPAFGVVMNALASSSAVNIVVNPSIQTLDNEEATIVVGRKIPFPTTSGLNNLGQPLVTFQREDVALTLKITPRVNSQAYVTLETEVEVQEIEQANLGLDTNQAGFITSKRQVKNKTLIRDNQTAVLGGLLGTTSTDSEAKVPILGDVPLIGALFRSHSVKARKSTLMVFMTPHIIDGEEDMMEILRVKEAQRQEYLRRFYGKSREKQLDELTHLLQYSMNFVDQPSLFRGPTAIDEDVTIGGVPMSDDTRDALESALEDFDKKEAGGGAGTLPPADPTLPDGPAPTPTPAPETPAPEEP